MITLLKELCDCLLSTEWSLWNGLLRNSLRHLWSATPGAKISRCAIKCESTCTCVRLYRLRAGQVSLALTTTGIASASNLGRRHRLLLRGVPSSLCAPGYKPLPPLIAPFQPDDA